MSSSVGQLETPLANRRRSARILERQLIITSSDTNAHLSSAANAITSTVSPSTQSEDTVTIRHNETNSAEQPLASAISATHPKNLVSANQSSLACAIIGPPPPPTTAVDDAAARKDSNNMTGVEPSLIEQSHGEQAGPHWTVNAARNRSVRTRDDCVWQWLTDRLQFSRGSHLDCATLFQVCRADLLRSSANNLPTRPWSSAMNRDNLQFHRFYQAAHDWAEEAGGRLFTFVHITFGRLHILLHYRIRLDGTAEQYMEWRMLITAQQNCPSLVKVRNAARDAKAHQLLDALGRVFLCEQFLVRACQSSSEAGWNAQVVLERHVRQLVATSRNRKLNSCGRLDLLSAELIFGLFSHRQLSRFCSSKPVIAFLSLLYRTLFDRVGHWMDGACETPTVTGSVLFSRHLLSNMRVVRNTAYPYTF